MTIEDMVYVGFNSRIAGLDRNTGEIIWQWKAPKGSRFVSLLLDGDRLIAAVQGYTYCLDPRTGQEMWFNPMKGFGFGVTSIASVRGHTPYGPLAQRQRQQQQAAAGAASAGAAS